MMKNPPYSSEKLRKISYGNASVLKAAVDKNPEAIETDGFNLSVTEK